MRPSRLIPLFAALVLALVAGGCRTVPLDGSGQTRAAYNYGEFTMVMHRTAPVLAAAAERALADLDLFMVGNEVQNYAAELKARTRDDRRVTVKIEEINSRETLLHIKVGLRGDLALSRAIYERIEQGVSQ